MSDDRKKMIKQAFDMVASGYDHPSLPFFPETAQRLLTMLDLQPGARILDVCTGTGAVALRAAEKYPDCEITGIDLSVGMLNQARQKAVQHKIENIKFLEMDLDKLAFPPAHFNVATCSFGLFFLPDMQAALKNIIAVVKPRGQIVISGFIDEAFQPFTDLFLQRYQSYGKEVQPLSWLRMSNEQKINELFSAVGINKITYQHVPLGHKINSPQQWWDVVWNAGFRGMLNQLTKEQCTEFEADHRQEIAAVCATGNDWLNTGVIIASARLD